MRNMVLMTPSSILDLDEFDAHNLENQKFFDEYYERVQYGAIIKVTYDVQDDNKFKEVYFYEYKENLFEIFECLDMKNGIDLYSENDTKVKDYIVAMVYGQGDRETQVEFINITKNAVHNDIVRVLENANLKILNNYLRKIFESLEEYC